jgi:Asp-tRNA(Asn)/Glu-tRNA(Gln) amidotransferase A subunit family amidase
MRETGSPFVLTPESRMVFMKAIEGVRAAGAEVILDDAILPPSFERLTDDIDTRLYVREGVERFLQDFGPQEYHSTAEFTRATGLRLPTFLMGPMLRSIETDIAAESNFFAPQRMALAIYEETLTKLHLDGFLYPALQVPSTDETARRTTSFNDGPHSLTAWVNKIGVPAVVVPAGYYANGLPFGLEFSARLWKDGDLLGWAFAYEQATRYRKAPVLNEK